MRVTRMRLRDFRGYAAADLALGAGLTVIHGRNGAGKTNLLEALYFGCTGRSCRTSNEREVVRFDAPLTRVEVDTAGPDTSHELSVAFTPGEPKRLLADGVSVSRLLDVPGRPLVSVFLPDRLELVKGGPGGRRAHLDSVVAAMWPARRETRSSYGQALVQRNALVARIAAGGASAAALDSWDRTLAAHGFALMIDRARLVDELRERFAERADDLGLDGDPAVCLPAALEGRERRGARRGAARAPRRPTSRRGFSGHGPHRDDLVLKRAGRELRAYGSQGQQRLALLALLLAEREALAATREATPLMLLDDVMSELDADRRERLVELLRSGGQSVITTTDLAHVPGADRADVVRVAIADGAILQEASAA